jgi:hypothetical protein
MPLLVELFVEAKALLAVGAIGDDRCGPLILELFAQFIAVVGCVPKHVVGCFDPANEALCGRIIMRLATGEQNRNQPSLSICECVNLSVAPTSRATNRLFFFPPFPPEAERCALIWVESIICKSVDRPRPAS